MTEDNLPIKMAATDNLKHVDGAAVYLVEGTAAVGAVAAPRPQGVTPLLPLCTGHIRPQAAVPASHTRARPCRPS